MLIKALLLIMLMSILILILIIVCCDRLDMGFEPQIRRVVEQLPATRQTQFFTATWPREVQTLAREFLTEPVSLQVGEEGQLNANKDIRQEVIVLRPHEKEDTLFELLHRACEGKGPGAIPKTIIFRNRKADCDTLMSELHHAGYSAESLHGDKSQAVRDTVMRQFREGRVRVLVATDVAARGLDVRDIACVVNFDFPDKGLEDYVHRIGRTGRGDAKAGIAYSLVTQMDARGGMAKQLVALLRRCNQVPSPELLSLLESIDQNNHPDRRSGFRQRSQGSAFSPRRGDRGDRDFSRGNQWSTRSFGSREEERDGRGRGEWGTGHRSTGFTGQDRRSEGEGGWRFGKRRQGGGESMEES
jgi:ATP-dependent RNA helicase DDX5/DBP2